VSGKLITRFAAYTLDIGVSDRENGSTQSKDKVMHDYRMIARVYIFGNLSLV